MTISQNIRGVIYARPGSGKSTWMKIAVYAPLSVHLIDTDTIMYGLYFTIDEEAAIPLISRVVDAYDRAIILITNNETLVAECVQAGIPVAGVRTDVVMERPAATGEEGRDTYALIEKRGAGLFTACDPRCAPTAFWRALTTVMEATKNNQASEVNNADSGN